MELRADSLPVAFVNECPRLPSFLNRGEVLEFASASHLCVALVAAGDRGTFRAFARGQGHPLGDCSVLFWSQGLLLSSTDDCRRRFVRALTCPSLYARLVLRRPDVAARLGLQIVVFEHDRLARLGLFIRYEWRKLPLRRPAAGGAAVWREDHRHADEGRDDFCFAPADDGDGTCALDEHQGDQRLDQEQDDEEDAGSIGDRPPRDQEHKGGDAREDDGAQGGQ